MALIVRIRYSSALAIIHFINIVVVLLSVFLSAVSSRIIRALIERIFSAQSFERNRALVSRNRGFYILEKFGHSTVAQNQTGTRLDP